MARPEIKLKILVILLLFCGGQFWSQQRAMDSLRAVLNKNIPDTSVVNTLNVIGTLQWKSGDYDSSLHTSERAKIIAEKINFKKGIYEALTDIGIVYWYQ